MPEPFRSRLTGTCNRCGQCCVHDPGDGGGPIACGFLESDLIAGHVTLGLPETTRCAVHAARYDGMLIPMWRLADSTFHGWWRCAKASAAEDAIIIDRGIGRGCSLTVRRDA